MPEIDPRLATIDSCLYRLAVKAIILRGDKVLMVRERDDEWWSLPGGGVEYGDDVITALKRELQEELGLKQQDIETDGKVVYVYVGAVVQGIPKANLFYRVVVKADHFSPTADVLEADWFDTKEIQDMFISPSTGGAKQVAAIIQALSS